MTANASQIASATFALHGVRCAGCVLKIERSISALPGVQLARGNATQKRLRLIWEDGAQTATSLTKAIQNLGYDAAAISLEGSEQKEESLQPRLAAAVIGTMNIMAFSFSVWAGLVTDMGPDTKHFMHWLSALVATPVVLYSGAVFHRPALRSLRAGRMTMDTPITLAIWITFAASLFETWRGQDQVYFDAVVSLILFLLIGRVLEQTLKNRSGDAAGNLRELMQITAHRIAADGSVSDTSVESLELGDRLIIYTGERLPADGTLLTSRVALNESVITGETMPRVVSEGAAMTAGAILVAGPAEMLVTHVGEDAQIGQMAQIIDDVTAHKGEMQKLSDRFAQGYIPLVIGAGSFGFLIWYYLFGASFADALMIAVAVLVVTCPCAAGLATPAVTSRAVNLLMQQGVVVKSGEALERLGAVDNVFLDKTGTASLPQPKVSMDIPNDVRSDVLALASASRHPLAQMLLGEADAKPTKNAVEYPGQGIEAPSGARLGSAYFVGKAGEERDHPAIWFRSPEGRAYEFEFQEMARDDLEYALKLLKAADLPVTLLSGDSALAVQRFAESHHIPHWLAEQSPEQKLVQVTAAENGIHSLMIGDGINDSAALSGAFVSASFAGATQIAQVASNIVLTQPHLKKIPQAIGLAQQARRLIVQNLTFSSIYNIVTVPLALAGLLSPLIAALLMSSSSVIVLANGLRLRMPT